MGTSFHKHLVPTGLLTGVAAISAGALRAIAAFVPATAAHVAMLYLAVDVLLLISLFGLWELLRSRIARGGLAGLALSMLASLALIAKDVGVFTPSMYAGAALTFALGLDVFAVVSWQARSLPRWILLCWLISTLIGPIGFFIPTWSVLFTISGVMFGIAFAGAGVKMMSGLSENS